MFELETWEWMLLGGVVYFAVTALVRLMRRQRDSVLNELSAQAEEEQRKKQPPKKGGESRRVTGSSNRKAS